MEVGISDRSKIVVSNVAAIDLSATLLTTEVTVTRTLLGKQSVQWH